MLQCAKRLVRIVEYRRQIAGVSVRTDQWELTVPVLVLIYILISLILYIVIIYIIKLYSNLLFTCVVFSMTKILR